MNLSPALQRAIAQIAKSRGISPEEFIVQTLAEKVGSLEMPEAAAESFPTGLKEKDGILVFETDSLNDIDFNALIAQSRNEISWEETRL
ncbi:MAG TPA: hypothetical protein IGS53_06120 [Leptolyngbyaceae cyanobacterium M33_DOE_097]|uniref:Uncharacterized protein n=1 Tax=Oscillatoriales cyanobacterium SpSt-418 TaxID=2282169 RepID=A0A7C3PDI1_9CYAN|nr:hypothetical protein [Leptolyngbyaceae cyanobacterium M33_DOE_097]